MASLLTSKGSSLLDVADLLLSTKTKDLNEREAQTMNDSQSVLNFKDTNFLDTLANLAAQKSPLKSNGHDDFAFSKGIQRRPRAYSESFVNNSSWEAASSINNETSDDITIPSMLDQYASLYNKNGRIGIYTKRERIDIIERFREKRRKRVWKKKIRYHCRKNLADKRVRVKGRFVKKTDDAPDVDNGSEEGMDAEGNEKDMSEVKSISNDNSTLNPNFIVYKQLETTVAPNVSAITDSSRESKDEGYERMRRHSIAY